MASGSRSTTPPYEPGGPPPISPALPPLELKGDVPSINTGERKIGEGKYLFLTLTSCLFEFQGKDISNQEINNVDKVILKSTNLRYILLNTIIHCSQFRQKKIKDKKHASLRCTNHLHLHLHRRVERYTGTPAASLFLDLWLVADRAVKFK